MNQSNTAKVVACISGKGGVGKTTLISNLGSLLASRGKKVLFIDLDYQANLTSCMKKLDQSARQKANIYRAYQHDADELKTPFPADFKPVNVAKNIDIITSSRQISKVNNLMRNKPAYAPYVIYHVFNALKLGQKYDYILLDCHNSFNLLTKGALVVADKVITPVTPSRFGISAVQTIIESIKDLRSEIVNPINQQSFITVKVPLFIGNMVDYNTTESHQFESAIKDNPMFVAMFHRRVLFSRATTVQSNVFAVAKSDLKNKHQSRNQNAVDKEIRPEFDKLIKAINK